MKRKTPHHSRLSFFWTLLLLVIFFALWEVQARQGHLDPAFFSRPTAIWRELLHLAESGLLARHLLTTLQEAGLGLFYGCLLGTVAGFFLAVSQKISAVIMPLMVGLNGLPKLALSPLLILWFGVGMRSKVVLAGLMAFFIFCFNLYAGYRGVDATLINTVRLLGGTRWQITRQVIWPSCLPWFLTSLRSGMGIALAGAIVGEYIGSTRGLGWLINDAGARYDMTRVLACVLMMVAVVVILDYLIRFAEKILLRWRPEAG